jgi:hypothetical protein
MIEKTTAAANLEFIQHTLAEVLAADPAQRDLVRFHVCEASECAKTLAAYLGQDAPNAPREGRAVARTIDADVGREDGR